MKKPTYKEINQLWTNYKKWTASGLLGNTVGGLISVSFYSLLSFGLIYSLFIIGPFKHSKIIEDTLSDDNDYNKSESSDCSVLGINLHGSLLTYVPEHADGDSFFDYDVTSSEGVMLSIKQANEDSDIKAVLIEVDSSGGSPVAGEEIANAVKNSVKPVVAFIRESGASAAYWSVSSADRIFASKNSNVGSIGVTSSYLNNVEKNKKDGYTYEQLSSGKFKDTGNPDKALTTDEKNLLLRDINIIYNNFINDVANNRDLTVKQVKAFADGSTVLGDKAKSLGMIDEIGGLNEAEKYIEGVIGEKPEVCW